MGTGTDDFKRLKAGSGARGFFPEIPTQAMPTPVTRGQETLRKAQETLRHMRRSQEAAAWYSWRLGLQREHGLYDPTPATTCRASSRGSSSPAARDRSTTHPPIGLMDLEWFGPAEW